MAKYIYNIIKGLLVFIFQTIRFFIKNPKAFLILFCVTFLLRFLIGFALCIPNVKLFNEACDGDGMFTVSEDFGGGLVQKCNADTKLSFGGLLNGAFNDSPFYLNVLKGHYNNYQYYWTNLAWNKYNDKEFMYMLASENGLFNHDRKSLVKGEDSWGFCQIHRGYHSEIVNDKRFFTEPGWQIEQCYKLFKGGTKFYGYIRFKQGGEFARARKALFNF